MDHEDRKRLLKLSAKDIAWQQSETTVLQPFSSQDHQMNIRGEPERRLLGTEAYSRPMAASTGRLSTMPWAGVRSPQASDMACMTAALMP